METFHENQTEGAKEIVKKFKEGVNYTVLLAEMQSGKSDTFMLAGAELVREGIIDQFVVFSGNAETALKKQARSQDEFWDKYEDYLYERLGEGRETRVVFRSVKHTWGENSVVWASELLKWVRPSGRTLFIWDESHFAQSGPSEKCPKGNRPYQFFDKQKLSATGGDHGIPGDLVLSVSATPFSEVTARATGETSKPVVYMKPGKEYRGLRQMVNDNQIKSYDVRNLESVFTRLALEVKDEGVGIIRVIGKKADDLKDLCVNLGVRVKVYDITDSNDINWYLGSGTQDARFYGVIIVKGKVKMGKQLKDKSRIRWCMETSVCSNTDTFLQGLAGRCMGYPASKTHKDIKIYVSVTYCLKGDHEKYITMMEHFSSGGRMPLELPSRAMNMVRKPASSAAPVINNKPTIPERIEIDISEWDLSSDDVKMLVQHHLKGDASEDFTLTSPNNKSVKRWEKKNGRDYVDEMNSAFKNKTAFKCPFPEPTAAKVWLEGCVAGQSKKVFYEHVKSLHRDGKPLVVYVQYRGEIEDAKEFVNETTGVEVFSNQPKVSETIEDNGTSSMSLAASTSASVQDMMSALEYFVLQTTSTKSPSSVKMGCSINSNAESAWKGIAVTPEVFASIKRGGIIYKQIFSKFNVKLSARKNSNSNPKVFPAKHVRLSSISW